MPRAGGRALAAAVVVGLAFDAAARNGIDTVSGLLLAVVGTQALAWSAPIRGRAARGALTLAVLASALLVLRASPWATAPLVLALALLAVLAASFDPDAPTRHVPGAGRTDLGGRRPPGDGAGDVPATVRRTAPPRRRRRGA
ncbi:MAG: hypothetical protein R2746_05230 [Acidimicrobiales bacterium]